jgi:hypothetical protein
MRICGACNQEKNEKDEFMEDASGGIFICQTCIRENDNVELCWECRRIFISTGQSNLVDSMCKDCRNSYEDFEEHRADLLKSFMEQTKVEQ